MMKMDFRSFLSEYGNVLVLLLLCLGISLVTIEEQSATSSSAARELAKEVSSETPNGSKVLVLVRTGEGATRFAKALSESLFYLPLTSSERAGNGLVPSGTERQVLHGCRQLVS